MGRIFSFSEIEKKKVPYRESFNAVARALTEDIGRCEAITSALACGSVLKSRHSRRSDFDCLVIFKEEKREKALAWMESFHNFANSHYFVPMQFIPVSDAVANTPLCHIEVLFLSHLCWATKNGGVIKGSPMEFLYLDYQNPMDDFRNYLRYKMRAMELGQVTLRSMDDAVFSSFLQKGLESPIHVARKMLQIKEMLPEEEIMELSKEKIVGLCIPYLKSPEQERFLAQLLELDKKYDEELEEQLINPDKFSYRAIESELTHNAYAAAKFMCHVATLVR